MITSTETDQSIVPLIAPTGDRVIVEPPQPIDRSDPQVIEGIHIPDGAKMKGLSRWAEVIGLHHVTKVLAVGEACKVVKVGERVVVTDRGMFYVNTGAVRFCAVQEGNIVAVVKG